MSDEYQEITLRRGTTLSLTTTTTAAVPADWSVYISLGRTKGGSEIADISPTFDTVQWVTEYDTNSLAAGTYWFDVKVLDPDGNEYWSDPVRIRLVEPNTKPE